MEHASAPAVGKDMEHDPFRNESEPLIEHRGLTGDHPPEVAGENGGKQEPVNEAFRNLVRFLKAPS